MMIGPFDRVADEPADRHRLERLLTESEQRLAIIPELEARITDLEGELASARDQIAAADARARTLDDELTRAAQAMVEVTSSSSWQLTKPLRRAQKMLS